MRRLFRRGLSDRLLGDLRDGPCATVFCACVDAGLDVRLRPGYLNLYFRGRSMARIVGRRHGPHKLWIHAKYAAGCIGGFAGQPRGSYLVFDVDAGFAKAYTTELRSLIRRAAEHVGHEENVELDLLRHNAASAEVFCFDRQVQMPGIRRRLDVVGLTAGRAPALVAIEVKRHPDNRIQSAPQQLHDYMEIFDRRGEGLRCDVAESYRRVCTQLRRLGLPAPEPSRITPRMPVTGLLVVSHYNCRSRLLSRAHAMAARLERPVYLWQPRHREFVIPAPERWLRMGVGGS